MNRYIAIVAASLVPWAGWLILDMLGRGERFQGLAFVFAAVATSQVVLMGARDPDCDAFKALLMTQALLNFLVLCAFVVGLEASTVLAIQMYGTIGQLAVTYTGALRRRRMPR